MTLSPAAVQALWARAFTHALAEAGVNHIVISPGSRSTPLALAATETGLSWHPVIDERVAAFVALGIARESGAPCALLCTSGSAGANYYPAIVEADAAGVPLIAITADRPAELRGCGANQTIDQLKLFGDRVRMFADLGPAQATDAGFRAPSKAPSSAARSAPPANGSSGS